MRKITKLLLPIILLVAMSLCLFVSCTDDKDYTDDALKAVHGAWVADGHVSLFESDGKSHTYYNAKKYGYYFDSDGYVYNIIDGEITDSKLKYKFSRAWGQEGKEVSHYIFEVELYHGETIVVTELTLKIQEKCIGSEGADWFEFDGTITR